MVFVVPNYNWNILSPIEMDVSRLACVFLVDTSGGAIEEVNQGLIALEEYFKEDSEARSRIDLAVISFNSTVDSDVGFCSAADYRAPHLSAGGITALNEAIEAGLDAVDFIVTAYKERAICYFRPCLFLLTDGSPTDQEKEAAAKSRLQDCLRRRKVTFFPMGIGDYADMNKLASYYPDEAISKPVLKADKNNFKELFVWLDYGTAGGYAHDPAVEIQVTPIPENFDAITVDI